MNDYEVGDQITYSSFGGPRTVTVTVRHEDVKRGRPGFSGYNADGKIGRAHV